MGVGGGRNSDRHVSKCGCLGILVLSGRVIATESLS
jgi:hypothetical protein